MEEQDDNKLIEERREKLKALRAQGVAFPNDFRPRDRMGDLAAKHGALDKPAAVLYDHTTTPAQSIPGAK